MNIWEDDKWYMDGLYLRSFMWFFVQNFCHAFLFLFRFPFRYSDFIYCPNYCPDGLLCEIFCWKTVCLISVVQRDFDGAIVWGSDWSFYRDVVGRIWIVSFGLRWVFLFFHCLRVFPFDALVLFCLLSRERVQLMILWFWKCSRKETVWNSSC